MDPFDPFLQRFWRLDTIAGCTSASGPKSRSGRWHSRSKSIAPGWRTPWESGIARLFVLNPNHIMGGRGYVRRVLYMATLVATRHNELIRQFYRRLLAKGKPKMVALIK